MNENDLFKAIGETDDELLQECDKQALNKSNIIKWCSIAAACIAVCAAAIKLSPDEYIPVKPEITAVSTSTQIQTTTAPPIKTAEKTTAPSGEAIQTTTINEFAEYINNKQSVELLSAAVYPETPEKPEVSDYEYSNWADKNAEYLKKTTELVNQPRGYYDGINDFCKNTALQMLKADNNQNPIYSPINLYMTLGLLSELTDGNTRKQLLDVMGVNDIETSRSKAESLWTANYSGNKSYSCILANSVWLSNKYEYKQKPFDKLAENYYASTVSGDINSTEMKDAIKYWLNKNTKGFLQDSVDNITFSENAAVYLASTVHFSAEWNRSKPYDVVSDDTTVFTTASGEVQPCEFITENKYGGELFSGSNFTAKSIHFDAPIRESNMWFVLPDEGVSTDEVLKNESFYNLITSDGNRENPSDGIEVNEYDLTIFIPKFDITYEKNIGENIKAMGITDVFTENVADFSPMSDYEGGFYVSDAQQAVRVSIDENGCEAASLMVVIAAAGGYLPEEYEKYTFKLDRPFIFAITGTDDVPLFIGVVNNLGQ